MIEKSHTVNTFEEASWINCLGNIIPHANGLYLVRRQQGLRRLKKIELNAIQWGNVYK
jgi:hypothetical protein